MKKSLFVGVLGLAVSVLTPVYGAGDPEAGKAKSAICAACHGVTGIAAIAEYPSLAGQGASYLVKQLTDFKEGKRENMLMSPMAAPLNAQDIEDLAAYFSDQSANAGVAKEENLQFGKDLYRGGVTKANIPACIGCHGPSGSGNPAATYPSLSGQNSGYVASALKEFRSGKRTNDANSVMSELSHRLTDAEIDALSNYVQGLH